MTSASPEPIPCFPVRPSDYDCQGNGTAASSNGTLPVKQWLYYNGTLFPNISVPCLQNNATTPPQCRQVSVSYTTGWNLTVVVEGINVRFYINGTRIPLTCSAPALTNGSSTSSSATINMVSSYYHVQVDQRPGRTLDQRVADIRTRISDYLRMGTSMNMPITIANVTLYPKENLVCCLYRTLAALGRLFVAFAFEIIETVRSLLTLPAAIPGYRFNMPTFRTALTDAQDAVCQFACLLMRIIPAECDLSFFCIMTSL